MKYYVVSDIHGFFTKMKDALEEKGFFEDKQSKLIVCGDMMDRGQEAVEMQDFMYELLQQDRLIFVKGNHESLLEDLVEHFDRYLEGVVWGYSHHVSNGTWSTALQLAGMTEKEACRNIGEFLEKVRNSKFYKELMPVAKNYFETENYIFVHAFIPLNCHDELPSHYTHNRKFSKMENWRNAWGDEWEQARWGNPFNLCERGFTPDKTLVFGHWHTSWPRYYYKGEAEWGKNADFSIYYGEGYIGIDACTAHSGKVNVLVLEDEG
jgi:serine/threonine protein phosphatase 1